MRSDLQKQAAAVGLLKNLVRSGVWKTVGTAAAKHVAKPGVGGSAARALQGTANVLGGKVGTALGAYGMAGMVSPLAGVNLPGSSLLMNVAMPGWGAAFTAPSLISSARLNSDATKKKIADDAQAGARNAASDFISLTSYDPRTASDANQYRKLLQQNGVDSKAADEYLKGTRAKPMSRWETLGNLFENPDGLVGHEVRKQVQDALHKQAGIGSVLGKALPWIGGLGSAGAIGHALLSDKPYDAEAVKQEGYAGAQAGIQKRLGEMNALERMAVKLDPTLAIQGLDKKLPGSIKAWEQRSGMKHRPGMLSSVANYWNSGGGEPEFYQYDASGNRHYLK